MMSHSKNLQMEVSWKGGTSKSSILNRIFHFKPSILEYLQFRKPLHHFADVPPTTHRSRPGGCDAHALLGSAHGISPEIFDTMEIYIYTYNYIWIYIYIYLCVCLSYYLHAHAHECMSVCTNHRLTIIIPHWSMVESVEDKHICRCVLCTIHVFRFIHCRLHMYICSLLYVHTD